jgi:hypothetical protein
MTKDVDNGTMNSFSTGATRDTSEGKPVYDKFLSPVVLKQFAKYMNMNRVQSDGKLRDGDNWQKGIPIEKYMESLYRHFMDMWFEHRGYPTRSGIMAAMCGILFNTMGYMHEILKHDPDRDMQDFDGDEPTPEMKERLEKTVTCTYDETGCGDCQVPDSSRSCNQDEECVGCNEEFPTHRHGVNNTVGGSVSYPEHPVEEAHTLYPECETCIYGVCHEDMCCPGYRNQQKNL